MNDVRTGSRLKGQIKCFQCRLVTRAREGGWKEHKNQQVFLCKSCAYALGPHAAIPSSSNPAAVRLFKHTFIEKLRPATKRTRSCSR